MEPQCKGVNKKLGVKKSRDARAFRIYRKQSSIALSKKSNPFQLSGHWSVLEHARFLEGFKLYGPNWGAVSDHVVTRLPSQVRSHAQKFFGNFTASSEKFTQIMERVKTITLEEIDRMKLLAFRHKYCKVPS
jgi:SHAQKYF class myb-like DNA-binding protein